MSETQVFGKVKVERLTRYSGTDLDDLCEATESAIVEGGGFGWLITGRASCWSPSAASSSAGSTA